VNYAGGLFFATGDYRAVFVSPDGYQWTKHAISPYYIKPPVRARDRFVSYGPQYGNPAVVLMWESVDGRMWRTSSLAYPPWPVNFYLTFGNGVLLGEALGRDPNPDVYLSEDMTGWTVVKDAVPGAWIYYGPGRFMFLYYELHAGQNYSVLYESPDGRTWAAKGMMSQPGSQLPYRISYANRTYLGFSSRFVFSSRDGVSWTAHDTGISGGSFNYYTDAVFWRGRFLLTPCCDLGFLVLSDALAPAVDQVRILPDLCRRLPDGGMLLTVEAPYGSPVTVEASADLRSWANVATDPCDRGEFEVYDDTALTNQRRFYRAYQTTNAPPPPPPIDPLSQWTQSTSTLTPSSGSSAAWRLAYGNGALVAAADNRAYSSPDGLNWTRTSTYSHSDVVFGAGRFVTVGGPPFTSTNGSDWTQQSAQTGSPYAITFGRGRFLTQGAAPAGGTGRWAYLSVDGVSWQGSLCSGLTLLQDNLKVLSFGRGRYLGAQSGFNGERLWSSPDVISWQPTFAIGGALGRWLTIDSLAYGHGRFVAVGHDSWATNHALVVTSGDGVHWARVSQSGLAPVAAVTYANGMFLGLGSAAGLSRVLTSIDGEVWAKRTDSAPVAAVYTATATFGNGRFIIVGDRGSVCRSEVVGPHVSQPQFWPGGCLRLDDGAMLLTVEAPYGRPVTVEASEDLRTWTTLATDPCDRGEFEVYDESAKTGKQRFYRAWQAGP
jgi:hypothetical protein